MEILQRLAAIAFSLGILGIAFLHRRLSGTWATPGAMFCAFWFLFSFIPLIALFSVPINPAAVAYILLGCVAFSIPDLLTNWRPAFQRNAALAVSRRPFLQSPIIHATFIIAFFTSNACILLDLMLQNVSFSNIFFQFFETSNNLLARRYAGEWSVNLYGQIGIVMAYLCVTFGGLVHAQTCSPSRRWAVLIMVMTPPIFIMLISAAKGTFVLAIAILLGAHLVHRVLTGKQPHVDVAALALQLKYLVFVAPLLVVSFLSRGLHSAGDAGFIIRKIRNNFAVYAFWHIYAFSDWFTFRINQSSLQDYTLEPPSLGYFTFMPLFEMFGSAKTVPPGVYDEYLSVGEFSGNIYTIFRGLITDFGLVGGLLFLLVTGALFNLAYRRMLTSRFPTISIALVFLFVHLLYTSYIISALIWNSTYAVTLLTSIILMANRWFRLEKNSLSRHPPRMATLAEQ